MSKRKKNNSPLAMDAMISEHVDLEISNMPLNNLQDYINYNAKARALNKKVRRIIYPIKQCPVELHPTQRIVFNRVDQPKNTLNGFTLSTDLIDFKMDLVPGRTYDLPLCVVDHLQSKGVPVWEWYELPAKKAGETVRETRISHYNPRFALMSVA